MLSSLFTPLLNGMTYANIFSSYLRMGKTTWQDGFLDYFNYAVREVIGAVYSQNGFVGKPATIVISGGAGSKVFSFDPAEGEHLAIVGKRIAQWLFTTSGMGLVPYTEGVVNYLGIRTAAYPASVAMADDGTIDFNMAEVGIGEVVTPSSVVDNGDGTVQIVLPLTAWTKAAATRQIVAWLSAPETASAEAFYAGVAVLDGGNVVVNVPHAFGQASVSTTAGDYSVFVRGPKVSTSVLSDSLYALLGQIDAVDTPSYADQRVLGDLALLGPAIVAVIEGAGVTFDPTVVTQLLDAVKGAFAVVGSLTDTGLVSTYFKRGLFVSKNCQVTGEYSAAVASENTDITGANSVSLASGATGAARNTLSGAFSVLMQGVYGSILSGTRSMLFGVNAELFTNNAIAGGIAGVAPAALGQNQNLKWILHILTGFLHLQDLRVGGSADDGTGYKIQLDGSTGDIGADRDIVAGGDLQGADVVLSADKTITRTIPLSAAIPLPHATPWTFAERSAPGLGYCWAPPDDPGTPDAFLILSLPVTTDRKIAKVTASVYLDAGEAGKVYGNLYRRPNDGGVAVALLATPIEWTAGAQGAKDITPDTGDVTIDGTKEYYLVMSVQTGTKLTVTGTAALNQVYLTEKLAEIG